MSEPLDNSTDLLELTADIVAAHVSNNSVSVTDLPGLISAVHQSLSGLGTVAQPVEEEQAPAVPIRSSIKPAYIICLEDGKKLKMLKRHLMTHYKLTPDAYRAKWKLPADYPMVAPNYAELRRSLAHKIGLGRKAAAPALVAAPAAAAAISAAPARKPRATTKKAAAPKVAKKPAA
ncbi:transcriptional regulator, MucR family [Sphingomonas sp. YR710]|uniref:MucR family transcriptional regulator n=1 Tax=Sphingomonas sp. YR710 TaxID=1882773 RepID=UPI0008878A3F|nr:MucR family transcriptional regulator [Sphingomonas sp. YR710]SDD30144.1 transcriptional regulator, MucR family [Sphingomonas sp. YR710]